ncbi:MAG: DUF6544 family protein [Saprospiraceae bacterium]
MIKYVFALLLLLHGLIHLMGFAKAFQVAEISQLTQPITKPTGALWGLSALLFTLASVLFILKKDSWWMWAIPAVILSQILVFSTWQDAKFGTIANVIVLVGAIIGFGTTSFYSLFENEVKSGLQQTASLPETILTEADLELLPAPVRKYIRYAGAVGKPKVVNFNIEFEGKIRKNEQSAWMPFTSEQYNFMDVPTRLFFMKATMKHLPVAGFHCFKNGKAFMDIRLLSLLKVQYKAGGEMDVSETVTFFNDMCCFAPSTLVDPRVKWLETDGNKVKASFTSNGNSITAWLYFNDEGQLVNFISQDRYAAGENGTMERLPWSTPLQDYKDINGHRVPGYADAVYSYPEGELVYGTFATRNVAYNCP